MFNLLLIVAFWISSFWRELERGHGWGRGISYRLFVRLCKSEDFRSINLKMSESIFNMRKSSLNDSPCIPEKLLSFWATASIVKVFTP